ncbi:PH domain-containing protein [Microbulbifer halophilus]|uniref:PH domain-containing protein n=1 Tax=Microbulbifer halophilus TaxID=453963 RepID=A0ABW5EEB8_9GAMM|nr:PH domain-containing protein [Microbulbifer halophilus]MCW8126374.1 PH domain-containing protein [Microbulbifer halophilus]
MQSIRFTAPWSRQLKWLTALVALLLLALPSILLSRAPETASALFAVSIWLPPTILALGALFAIRGYEIEGQMLRILRPGWKTRIDLKDLQSAEVKPEAMRGSVRIFGNGGLFGFIGLFRNSTLGRYRAFATDSANCVVLRFPVHTLVVTPDRPEQFIAALNTPTP